jgi:hypothetical protein
MVSSLAGLGGATAGTSCHGATSEKKTLAMLYKLLGTRQ